MDYEILSARDDGSGVWDWMQFLRARRKEEFEMVAAKNPEIRKAVNTLYELSADREVRAEYEMRLKAVRDTQWWIDSAREEGREEGEKKGMKEGVEKLLNLLSQGKSMDEAKKILGID